jgi:hypothetical protein
MTHKLLKSIGTGRSQYFGICSVDWHEGTNILEVLAASHLHACPRRASSMLRDNVVEGRVG